MNRPDDQPFYVDVGTSIAAVRCASDDAVLLWHDHGRHGRWAIDEVERTCRRMNDEAARHYRAGPAGDIHALREALVAVRRFVCREESIPGHAADCLLSIIDPALSTAPVPESCAAALPPPSPEHPAK